MSEINIELGGVVVSVLAGLTLNQNYTSLGGSSLLRTLNGTGIKQQHWQKTKIVTSGSGWIPAGLQELDYSAAMILKCSAPRQQQGAGNVFTLPATRRSDAGYEPVGFALVDDDWIETAVALVTDTATLTIVSGATSYRVIWFPQFTVLAQPPEESWQMGAASHSWTLTAEEA